MSEQGAVGSVLIALVGLVLLLTVALASVSGLQSARQRATSAADAAALAAAPVTFLPLAAVGSPAQEAARFARLNGTTLVSCRCEVDRSFASRDVQVVVRTTARLALIGSVTVEATGRAEFVPAALLGE